MKNISSEFKRALFYNKRNYIAYAEITLVDGTTLNLTNNEIWQGGYSREEAISEDENFTVLGSVIINSATLIINNINDKFSSYTFEHATVKLSEAMSFNENGTTRIETLKAGTYIVDSTNYNGATIRLSLIDNMSKFDRPYSESSLAYPATCFTIVRDACSVCGVQLNDFESALKNLSIQEAPTEEGITFREVISWVATICGCYAKCNVDGELDLKWINTSLLQQTLNNIDGGEFDSGTPYYTTGDNADGGAFNPWNNTETYDGGEFSDLDDIAIIKGLASQNICIDDTVIAGVRILIKDKTADSSSDILSYVYPSDYTEGFVVEISDNEFITTNNVNTILNHLGTLLYGMTFRKLNVTQLSDPSIEAGDIGLVIDRKQHAYAIIVTRCTFKIGSRQTIVCGSESALNNSSTRFSQATKTFLETKALMNVEKNARIIALQDLADALDSKSGLYTTVETASSGSIFYLHDLPDLSESKVVWKMTDEGWGVTTNYNGAHPEQTVWNAGMTVDGNAIVRILSAEGINADWIDSGTIRITDGNGNVTFEADTSTGAVRINATSFSLTGRSINELVQDAVNGMDLNNITIELDNDYQLIPTDADGNYTTFPQCSSTAKVFYGSTDITNNVTFSTPTTSNVTGSWNASTKTYTVTSLTADSGIVTFAITFGSTTLSKQFTVAKAKQGENGTSVTITSTSVMYKASTSATTIPTGTWSNSIVSANGKFLWTRTVVSYSDGTSTTSYSVSRQGIDGTNGTNGTNGRDGTNGTSNFVHIKYSPVANPSDSDITETPDEYIGICVNTTQADPTTASSYTWTKFKGDDGEQGIPGTNGINGTNGTNGRDGVSSYVHFAYSTSSDGHDNFSTTNFSGATYLGVLTDSNVADSTNYADYEWSLIKGADGADGTSVTILGSYNTVAELQAAHPTGSTGDAYIVSGDLYVWVDNTWTNVGQIQGPAGQNGTNGTNGTSAYVHFAYATSSDGQENFSVVAFNGATYIGVRSDSTQADSTNYQDYTWSKIKGDDGTSITITSTTIRYKEGTSATTAPTGTWSSTIPSVAGGNYLWTRTIVNYSDGTSTTSYSVARQGINGTNGTNGINGTNGTNGTSSYVHIKYSAVANPTNAQMTEIPSDYIGLCIDNNEPDPTTASSYTWTRWTGVDGTNGTNGTNGIDGTPAYVHFAYAKSADGSQNFSNVYFDSAVYIGVRSDASVADSTNYRDYTWSKMRGDDGKGITSITEYYGVSNSENTQPASWSTSVVNPSASNKYLWNYNTTAYTSGNPTSTTPRIIGMYSADGTNGRGISSITEYYQVSSSSTTAPTSWSTSMVNTTTTNKYLWNYEKITYTDGSEGSSIPRIIGTHGATGTSARSYLIEVSPKATKLTNSDAYSPNNITIKSYYRDGTSANKTAYSATYIVDVCVGNTWYNNVASISSKTTATLEISYSKTASEPYEFTSTLCDFGVAVIPNSSSIRIRMMNGNTLLDQEEVALLIDSTVVMTQESIFNALTNGGEDQGIFLAQDPEHPNRNKIFINSSYIATGELVVGGYNNGNGTIAIKNSSNYQFGLIDNNGLLFQQQSTYTNNIYYGCRYDTEGIKFFRGNSTPAKLEEYEIATINQSGDAVYSHMALLLQSQQLELRAQDGRDLILGFYDYRNQPLDKYVLKVDRANINVPVHVNNKLYATELHPSNGDTGTVTVGNKTLYITDGIITAIM